MPRLHPLKELIVINEKPRSARLRPLRIGNSIQMVFPPQRFHSTADALSSDRWNSHYSRQKANLIRAWTRPPSQPLHATLIKKTPIARSAAPTLPVQPVTDTDESCRKSWVVQPTKSTRNCGRRPLPVRTLRFWQGPGLDPQRVSHSTAGSN